MRQLQGLRAGRAWVGYMVIAGVLAILIPQAALAGSGPASDSAAELFSLDALWTERHPTVSRTFDEHVAYHRHFRSGFDFLDDSDAAIADVIATSPANGSLERWGLEMTNSEMEEMERRQRIQANFPAVAGAVVGDDWSEELIEGRDPDGSFGAFAGRWIDQQDGGRLYVALVPEHAGYEAAIERGYIAHQELVASDRLGPNDVVFVDAQFTADQLYTVNRDFAEIYLLDSSIDRKAVGMSASMSQRRNQVELYAEPDFIDIAYRFASMYPPGLVVVVPTDPGYLSPSDDTDPKDDWGAGDWHAGAAIDVKDGNGNFLGGCMWGATARTSSYVYAIMAAHCLNVSYGNTDFWWNYQVSASSRRGFQTWGGDDLIADPSEGFVGAYHDVYGDIARVMITETATVTDYDCYLESYTECGRTITRREYTWETEEGDTKCVAFGFRDLYVCAEVESNDAPQSGYDYLRQLDTNLVTESKGGDSGAGWKEASLMMGINKGHTGPLQHDSIATHAYYVDQYVGTLAFCGSSGVCNN